MRFPVPLIVVALALVAGCGQGPQPGADGRVDATPRTLAAIVEQHVHPGQARRTTGRWSDFNDPLTLEAQVDYGVDPEGSEDGESHTVRVRVADTDAFSEEELGFARCQPEDQGRCEEEQVDGDTVVYRWDPGYPEEEPGSLGWTVVRPDELVFLTYQPSGLFDVDPRTLDLRLDWQDLRAAAIDPAMSLRTTPAAFQAGEALDDYEGMETAPEKPEIRPTTPEQLAERILDYMSYSGRYRPSVVEPSDLDVLGPDAVGVHLEFPGRRRFDPFNVDLVTVPGRAPQLDDPPCPVQRSGQAARLKCFAWDEDTFITWQLATPDTPGSFTVIGSQEDDTFNRTESVAIRVVSTGITQDYFVNHPRWTARIPVDVMGDLYVLTGDLSIGPERRSAVD